MFDFFLCILCIKSQHPQSFPLHLNPENKSKTATRVYSIYPSSSSSVMKALLFTFAYALHSVAAASLPVHSDSDESVQATCSSSTFTKVLPQGASIEKVATVPQNGQYGEGAADLNYPYNPTGLPALCAVTVKVVSSNESSFRFGLFLPASNQWTGRLLAIGNGGFGGGINWLDMYVLVSHAVLLISASLFVLIQLTPL